MKRVLSALLAAVTVLLSVSVGTAERQIAVSAATESYYTYTVTDGEATITDVDTLISGDVNVPSVLGGYPVTGIGPRAFYGCSEIKSVVVPNSVESIGEAAFRECFSLYKVKVSDNVEYIAQDAFDETGYYWSYYNWENDVFYVGRHLLEAKPTLSGNYTVKVGTKTIADKAFNGCSALTAVTIPEGVTRIGKEAFRACDALTAITIPATATSIGEDAFIYCDSLASLAVASGNPVYHSVSNGVIHTAEHTLVAGCKATRIPADGRVTRIGNSAFRGCASLTAITVPAAVKTIGNSAFMGCTSLAAVVIENGVTTIEQGAFSNCKELSRITLPESVTHLGEGAFIDCVKLTKAAVLADVRCIESSLFSGCTSLQSVTLSASVTDIMYGAFWRCDALSDVYYGGSLSDRRNIAFGSNNAPLQNAVWHYNRCLHENTADSGYRVPTCAEDGYSGDTVCVACGDVVKTGEKISARGHTFGDDAVCDVCGESDGSLQVDAQYCTYQVTDGEATITKVSTALGGRVAIPSVLAGYPVTAIGNNAFKGCVKITELTIPAGITKIGDYAFRNCTALTTVYFNAADCTVMGAPVYPVFGGCTALATVYIGQEVTQIPANAFRGVTALTTLYITKNTAVIYANAFHQTALTDVYYVGKASDYTRVDVKSYNTVFDEAIFAYNTPCVREHIWTADCDPQCDLCNTTRVTVHERIVHDQAAAPSCVANGVTAGSHCESCDTVIEAPRSIPAFGHAWDAGTVLAEPSAEANGSKTYTCTACGDTKTVVLTLSTVENGKYRYDGKVMADVGLVQVEDAYYYVGSGGNVRTGRYMVSNVNGLPFERGIYYFDKNGRMNTTEGVYEGYYFNEHGKLTPYAGLVEWNIAKYYVNNNGKVNAGGFFYISNLNGLLPKACLRTFYPDGRMLEETRIYDADGHYYENGARTPYAGMVEYKGHWYYVNDGGAYVKQKIQVLTNVNNSGLTRNRRCYFDENGHMVRSTVVNGAYYGADGMAPDYAGVVKDSVGNLYYVSGTHGKVNVSKTFTVAAVKTNGLCASGRYTADENGVLTPAE
ncbi:MAG: hypothetical protein E7552_07125 [Ruminococcaceae bacterium]|nr:hypothetical protein [Oscillospiraceae bacterium]